MTSESKNPRSGSKSSVQHIDLFGDIAVGPGESTHAAPPRLPPIVDNDKTVISNRPPLASLATVPHSHTLGELLIGKSLDHYELVEFVGGGGMGAVFRANDTRLGRTVAVKVLSRDQTDDETIRRFQNEAQSAARLDHPNIARVYYVGEADGWNYIVFEFISGQNARDIVLQDGPLSVENALRYTLKIAAALDHAAKREVVHRDIKPSNILIADDGEVKLVDMGLARLHQVESSADDLTASGVTLGTFDYISPEQARDPRLADVRSDIYSLGCTLYFLLCGQPPFPEGTALQKLLKHNGDDPPDMRQFRPELSDRLVRMTERMLAKKPTQRFQSAADLSAEILLVAADLGITGLESPLGIEAAALRATRSRWSESIAVVAPIALLILLVFITDLISSPSAAVTERPFAPRLKTDAEPMKTLISPVRADNTSKTIVLTPSTITPDKSLPPSDEGTSTKGTVGNESEPNSQRPTRGTGEPPAEPAAESSTGNGSTTTTETPSTTELPIVSPKKNLTRVIVRPGENKPELGVVGQLAQAVKLAHERGATEIELQFQGPLVERPFDLATQSLTIKAGDGFRPVVLFQPATGGLVEEQRMIRLAGSGLARITWRGVEFRLELPAESSSHGWSLFGLQQVHTLTLEDCIVTLKNSAPGGGPLHYPTAVFEFLPPKMTDTMMDTTRPAMSPATAISLSRCLIRGETALVQMNEETPCEFVWRQGVLAISDSILRTSGTTSKPKWYGQMEWRWEHVSAFARGGWYQLQRRDDASYQFDLDIRCDHCQLLWGKGIPLFDFQNGPLHDEIRLQFEGLENGYVSEEQLFLSVRPKGETKVDYDLRHRQEWTNERRAHFDLSWSLEKASELPLHAWTRERFPLVDETNSSGSDPALLPSPFVVTP